MSRHTFETRYQNRAVEVVLGYDRPLDHIFLMVVFTGSECDITDQSDVEAPGSEPDCDPDDDCVVYSNLTDPDAGFHQGLDYYRAKLASLGITVPESVFRETEQDAINCVGNRFVVHHEDGRLETIQDA